MGGRVLAGVLAAATVMLADPALAGGAGGFHGGGFRRPMMRPAMGGPRWSGGGGWHGGARPMPPVAGVIHERPGGRPYYSAYGHANTGYAPVAGGARWGDGIRGFGGYGHVASGYRGGFDRYGRARYREVAGDRWERERSVDGRRLSVYRYGRRYGGYDGGGGVYLGGDAGLYGGGFDGGGGYGTPGTYGAPGTYGTPGSYGRYGTEGGYGGAYVSEPPLAATRTEAPLAPSPYGADDGSYAQGGSGVAPHILTVDRSRGGCGCAPAAGAYPTIYRYGVGTAY